MKRRYIAMFMSAVMACSQFSGAAVTAMAEDVIVEEDLQLETFDETSETAETIETQGEEDGAEAAEGIYEREVYSDIVENGDIVSDTLDNAAEDSTTTDEELIVEDLSSGDAVTGIAEAPDITADG